jgi:hypothetical protein
MLEFLEKDHVLTIIDGFSKQYNLVKELDEQLKLIVDDYKEKKKEIKVVRSISMPEEEKDSIHFQNKKIEIELTSNDDKKSMDYYHIIDK